MSNPEEQSGKGPATDYWGWFATAQQNVKVFAENAGKVAQEKAAALVKHAEEMRQNYDMELATSILMGTVGGPIDPNGVNPNSKAPVKLTREAVQQLDMNYVTENIISMSFPCDFSKKGGTQAGNDINIVAAYLKRRHEGKFMIWNISEEGYDYSKFADQVLEYKFPGHPSPPLGLLFKICTSVESWLDADEKNVAIIHCLTGKGRTAALVACVMTWIGEFASPMEALQYIADRRKITVDHLTIPSQRRYIQYFSNMLDGVKPRSEPLLLRRVIINCIPVFGSDSEEAGGSQGCCPYVQLFKNGKLIATAAAQGDSPAGAPAEGESHEGGGEHNPNGKMQLRWIKASDGSASFNVDCPVQGDILLRCRHVARSGVRVSMFRTGFHTGYVPSGVLRLTKAQLDGSSTDPRFDDDFFVDLIFSPIHPASNINPEDVNTSPSVPVSPTSNIGEEINLPSAKGLPPQAASDSGLLLEASSADKFEMTLHRDAKFWDAIANRKLKAKKRKARKFLSHQQERFSIGDDLRGEDDAGTTEVNFYSSFTPGAAAASSSSAQTSEGPNAFSSMSDMDLIMQLAELEGGGGGSGAEEVSFPANVSFSDLSESKPPASTNSTSTTSKVTAASSELQVLEELERELGLDNFLTGPSITTTDPASAAGISASAPKAAASSAFLDDDENLDELEKYLQSLGTKS